MPFINDDFLLHNAARAPALPRATRRPQPILDYHCHLPPKDIAENRRFKNLFEIWLEGDHYKWRAMRANGVRRALLHRRRADPYEKFLAWAATVPHCLRNPLYHWTHLELQRYFGIDELLDETIGAGDLGGRPTSGCAPTSSRRTASCEKFDVKRALHDRRSGGSARATTRRFARRGSRRRSIPPSVRIGRWTSNDPDVVQPPGSTGSPPRPTCDIVSVRRISSTRCEQRHQDFPRSSAAASPTTACRTATPTPCTDARGGGDLRPRARRPGRVGRRSTRSSRRS